MNDGRQQYLLARAARSRLHMRIALVIVAATIALIAFEALGSLTSRPEWSS